MAGRWRRRDPPRLRVHRPPVPASVRAGPQYRCRRPRRCRTCRRHAPAPAPLPGRRLCRQLRYRGREDAAHPGPDAGPAPPPASPAMACHARTRPWRQRPCPGRALPAGAARRTASAGEYSPKYSSMLSQRRDNSYLSINISLDTLVFDIGIDRFLNGTLVVDRAFSLRFVSCPSTVGHPARLAGLAPRGCRAAVQCAP